MSTCFFLLTHTLNQTVCIVLYSKASKSIFLYIRLTSFQFLISARIVFSPNALKLERTVNDLSKAMLATRILFSSTMSRLFVLLH